MENRCALCQNKEESIDHLLIHFNYINEVFHLVLQHFNLDWMAPRIVSDFLHQWENLFCSSRLRKLWDPSLSYFWWGIWKERNYRVFQDANLPAHFLSLKITNFILENVSIVKFKSLWEILEEALILLGRGLVRRMDQRAQYPHKISHQIHPPVGWILINYDGSSKCNPGPASMMSVVRYHKGKIVLLIAKPLGIQTSNFAKAQVAFISLSMLGRINCNNIILISNSLNVVNML